MYFKKCKANNLQMIFDEERKLPHDGFDKLFHACKPNANTNNNGLIFTNKRHCCVFFLLQHNAVEKIFFYICFQGKFPTEFEEQIGSPRGFIVQWNRPMRSNVVLIVCRFANGTFYSLGISMAMRAVGQAITHVLRACRLRLALVIFAELLLCQ
ncbi:hypothetical protein T01_12442 [Trichinella spiralis]|uniref:Uncharacterized protein n=1 Tax=Trichinella spiralis TaxID=6334 RepID=A0A0V1BHN9_TRISP|nr:hypothetical protein T01_12442 [Trichinella spiralis]